MWVKTKTKYQEVELYWSSTWTFIDNFLFVQVFPIVNESPIYRILGGITVQVGSGSNCLHECYLPTLTKICKYQILKASLCGIYTVIRTYIENSLQAHTDNLYPTQKRSHIIKSQIQTFLPTQKYLGTNVSILLNPSRRQIVYWQTDVSFLACHANVYSNKLKSSKCGRAEL